MKKLDKNGTETLYALIEGPEGMLEEIPSDLVRFIDPIKVQTSDPTERISRN
jgi:hypothetical protein